MKRSPFSRLFFLMICFVTLGSFRELSVAYASRPDQLLCFSDYTWQELEMGSFVLVFPVQNYDLAQDILTTYSNALEKLNEDYSRAFSIELTLPISIRIYPTQEDYYCLNQMVPIVGEDETHSHVGGREIALFGYQIRRGGGQFTNQDFNGLRHELAVLFALEITNGYVPAGLLNGIGGYAELPEETFPQRYELAGSPTQPDQSWKVLWEEAAPLSDQRTFLQATSITAYLIDVHGWDKFIDFLVEVNLQQGYRQALTNVYGISLQEIEDDWQAYFPTFVSQRWQVNIIHSYDLEVFRQLIAAGAYNDSISGLEEAVFLIEIFGEADQLQIADALLNHANLGAQAGALTLESRQALFAGKFEESYQAAVLALEYYAQLGDTRRVSELQAYLAASKEVLDLRAGLEVIRQEGIGINPFKSPELFSIGQRLIELGDEESAGQVEVILSVLGVGQNTFFQFFISLVIFVSMGLIIRRIIAIRTKIPPEADLI